MLSFSINQRDVYWLRLVCSDVTYVVFDVVVVCKSEGRMRLLFWLSRGCKRIIFESRVGSCSMSFAISITQAGSAALRCTLFLESRVGSCSMCFIGDAVSIAQTVSAALRCKCHCYHGVVLRLLWACVCQLQQHYESRLDGIVNGRLAAVLALSEMLAAGHVALPM